MGGTTTLTSHKSYGLVRRIVVDFVADAADGSVPSLALPAFEGQILEIETNPGSTAPTDNYDIALNDAEGGDRLLGAGQNRDTATTERANVAFSSSSSRPTVSIEETLTLAISGNSVNSATGRLIIYYSPGLD